VPQSARVWEVEGDDVATCYWLNFERLDAATCHSLIDQFNKWRISTWHDLVENARHSSIGNPKI